MRISIKRVYEKPSSGDGFRILVDRLWPRGLTKEKARVDLWLREVGPSNDLRKWFAHDPARWSEFRRRYAVELRGKQALLDQIVEHASSGPVTLLFGAKDEEHNQAVALKGFLQQERTGARGA